MTAGSRVSKAALTAMVIVCLCAKNSEAILLAAPQQHVSPMVIDTHAFMFPHRLVFNDSVLVQGRSTDHHVTHSLHPAHRYTNGTIVMSFMIKTNVPFYVYLTEGKMTTLNKKKHFRILIDPRKHRPTTIAKCSSRITCTTLSSEVNRMETEKTVSGYYIYWISFPAYQADHQHIRIGTGSLYGENVVLEADTSTSSWPILLMYIRNKGRRFEDNAQWIFNYGVCKLGSWQLAEQCTTCGRGYSDNMVEDRVKSISSSDGRIATNYAVDLKYLDTSMCLKSSSKFTPCNMQCSDCLPMDVTIVLALSQRLSSIKHNYFEKFITQLFNELSQKENVRTSVVELKPTVKTLKHFNGSDKWISKINYEEGRNNISNLFTYLKSNAFSHGPMNTKAPLGVGKVVLLITNGITREKMDEHMKSDLASLKKIAKIVTVRITQKDKLAIATCSKHALFSTNYHLEEMTRKILIASCVKELPKSEIVNEPIAEDIISVEEPVSAEITSEYTPISETDSTTTAQTLPESEPPSTPAEAESENSYHSDHPTSTQQDSSTPTPAQHTTDSSYSRFEHHELVGITASMVIPNYSSGMDPEISPEIGSEIDPEIGSGIGSGIGPEIADVYSGDINVDEEIVESAEDGSGDYQESEETSGEVLEEVDEDDVLPEIYQGKDNVVSDKELENMHAVGQLKECDAEQKTTCVNSKGCLVQTYQQLDMLSEEVLCECQEGFYGETCSELEDHDVIDDRNFEGTAEIEAVTCLTRLCENGGTCIHYKNNDVVHRYCKCPPGVFGEFCEYGTQLELNSCHLNPCKNGAKCVLLKHNDYVPKYELPQWTKEEYFRKLMAAKRTPAPAPPTPMMPIWDGRRPIKQNIPMRRNQLPRKYMTKKFGGRRNVMHHRVKTTNRPWKGKKNMDMKIMSNNKYNSLRRRKTQQINQLHNKNKHTKPKFNPFFPNETMKHRPLEKVDYKCECTMGFTGYNCHKNVELVRFSLYKRCYHKVAKAITMIKKFFHF